MSSLSCSVEDRTPVIMSTVGLRAVGFLGASGKLRNSYFRNTIGKEGRSPPKIVRLSLIQKVT